MDRKNFLKKSTIGVLGAAALATIPTLRVQAAPTQNVRDNVRSDGTHRGSTPPTDGTKMWLNTGNTANTFGVNGKSVPAGSLSYYTAEGWKPITAVWSD